MIYLFQSERLGFRPWTEADKPDFARLASNPLVMEFFPSVLSRSESDVWVDVMMAHHETHGVSFYVTETLADAAFIGFIGLAQTPVQAYFAPSLEVGWRLLPSAWGKGYATEGARRCLQYAFEELKAPEVHAITGVPNRRSERVMQKIGMHQRDNFLHPKLPEGHWLKEHVVYRALPTP